MLLVLYFTIGFKLDFLNPHKCSYVYLHRNSYCEFLKSTNNKEVFIKLWLSAHESIVLTVLRES